MLFLPLILSAIVAAEESPWSRHTIDDASQGADGVRLGDVNRDGFMDIATAWEEGGVVRVAVHPGNADVREPWPSVTVGTVKSGEDAVFVDLDGNGQLDVVSACEGNVRSIFVHWAPDNADHLLSADGWKTERLPVSEQRMKFMFVLPMDVNDDGRIDLVAAGKGNGAALGWFESPDSPRDLGAWTWHELTPVGWVMSIRSIDLDGDSDGRNDVLVSDRRGPSRGVFGLVRPNDPLQTWRRIEIGGHDAEVMFIDAKPKGFGLFELAWVEKPGPVHWMTLNAKALDQGLARRRSLEMPLNVGGGKAVALGDLNDDKMMDIVVSCESADGKPGVFALLYPSAAGARVPSWRFEDISGLEGTKFDRIELIDLDGDGDLDVLTCEERENLGVIWYENPLR